MEIMDATKEQYINVGRIVSKSLISLMLKLGGQLIVIIEIKLDKYFRVIYIIAF
jgi:hypothetical protein